MESIQLLGLGIVIVFYVAYLSKQIVLRKRGIQANLLGRGKKPKKTFYTELALAVTTYAMAALQFVSIIWYEKFPLMIPDTMTRVFGIAIALVGVIVFIMAMNTMKESWRAGVDASQKTKFVSEGIYKISRNPAFVGFDLLYIGIGLAFSNPLYSIVLVLPIILFHLQILEEEKHLEKVFGKQYKKYKDEVKRYV